MFIITLLQTNGSRKGSRYCVDSSPFLIGRSDQCKLTFASRTVSRKHCVLLFDGSHVLIRDLDSRNGTIVDGVMVQPTMPTRLSHHCEIRIGKYSFRISIRDSQTKRPHQPDLVDWSTVSGGEKLSSNATKDAHQLLSELDDLASNLDSVEVPGAQPIDHQDGTAAELPSQSTVTYAVPPQQRSNSQQHTPAGDSTEDEATNPKQTEANKKDSTTPNKLPSHLRPAEPKDSQDAAAKALRNLFVR